MPGNQRPARPKDQIKEAARHITHEVQHLLEHAVSQVTDDRGVPVVFLEAGLSHARNLIEFFECPGKSYISPVDFYSKFVKPAGIDAANRDLNNWLSHLTWLRVDERAPSAGEAWDNIPLVTRLAEEFLTFV